MSVSQQEEKNSIVAVLRALRPGRLVELVDGDGNTMKRPDGTPICVTVNEVKFRQMDAFSEALGEALPRITSVVASRVFAEEKGDRAGLLEAMKTNPAETAKRIGLIGSLIPVIMKHLGGMVRQCVEPEGILDELPHDLAAPVVSRWVEINVLNPGKLEAWRRAGSAMMNQAKNSKILSSLMADESKEEDES